jgi:hypothetical protein
MTVLRLFVMYLIGLSAWGLTFGRSLAWHGKRAALLVCIVMADEMIGLFAGMYLARNGAWYEVVAIALGGATSALMMLGRKSDEAKD